MKPKFCTQCRSPRRLARFYPAVRVPYENHQDSHAVLCFGVWLCRECKAATTITDVMPPAHIGCFRAQLVRFGHPAPDFSRASLEFHACDQRGAVA